MSEDHDRCFSILFLGAFSTGVFNTNVLPRINIGADVLGESSIKTGVCNAGARLLCTSDGVCVIVYVQFSSVGAGMV
jgi:hypothetical protein